MCGIAGSFAWGAFEIEQALDRIAHRGPDGRGIKRVGDAVHGHVRLSLVDLSDASAQPFVVASGSVGGVLSFNGEVWNHKAVRADLEAEGCQFRTRGDTEVMAQAILHWGLEQGLERLDGMFAFAWSGTDKQGCTRDVLVRDRFGKIPLYVTRKGKGFAWSSERKGLLPLPARPLPPASILDLRSGTITPWYALPGCGEGSVLEHLTTGVAKRLDADAPVCVLVSGGLDSSLVLALAHATGRKVHAYTAVYDQRSQDLAAARAMCAHFEVGLTEVQVKPITAAMLEAAAHAIEIPLKTQVEIAALCIPLAEAIAKDGFKACLSGEGADEIFGGYGSMCIKGAKASDRDWRALRVAQLEKMARGNFIRCNKAFMQHGVECRLPFLERSLVELALGMTKAECPPGKKALKSAAARLVPKKIISRPKDTFQGASGLLEAAEKAVADPRRFYRTAVLSKFGSTAVER
jgi:asparagine synthase (glutamine-hydrolysing)